MLRRPTVWTLLNMVMRLPLICSTALGDSLGFNTKSNKGNRNSSHGYCEVLLAVYMWTASRSSILIGPAYLCGALDHACVIPFVTNYIYQPVVRRVVPIRSTRPRAPCSIGNVFIAGLSPSNLSTRMRPRQSIIEYPCRRFLIATAVTGYE